MNIGWGIFVSHLVLDVMTKFSEIETQALHVKLRRERDDETEHGNRGDRDELERESLVAILAGTTRKMMLVIHCGWFFLLL